MAVDVDLASVWSAAGVIAGFQVAAFTLRISREIKMSDEGEATWLPIADMLNLVSLGLTLIGVFVAPVLGLADSETATTLFAWSVLLLAGWPITVAAHYELYNRRPRTRPAPYATKQEWIALSAVLVASVVFWILVLFT